MVNPVLLGSSSAWGRQEVVMSCGFFSRYPILRSWRIDYVFHSPDLVALHTAVGRTTAR